MTLTSLNILNNTDKAPQFSNYIACPNRTLTRKVLCSSFFFFFPFAQQFTIFFVFIIHEYYQKSNQRKENNDNLRCSESRPANSNRRPVVSVRDLTWSGLDWSFGSRKSLCTQNSILKLDRRYAGGCFRRVLLEPTRWCPHQSPLSRWRWVSSSLSLSTYLTFMSVYMGIESIAVYSSNCKFLMLELLDFAWYIYAIKDCVKRTEDCEKKV